MAKHTAADDVHNDGHSGVRIGLRGAACATVDASGAIHPDSWRGAVFAWWVAASDRWHDPQHEPSIRQRCIDGAPVVETKLAVPGGDVVARVYVVADQGGCVVMQVHNESPGPVAIAVSTVGLSSTAAAGGAVPQGVKVPAGVTAFPVAHRSMITFAWPVQRPRWKRPLAGVINAAVLPSPEQVVRGWVQSAERASRVTTAHQALVRARATVLLATARDLDDVLQADPAIGVLAIGERVRMGDPAREWVSPLADAASRIARKPGASLWSRHALVIAARVLTEADEAMAASDVIAAWQQLLVAGSLFDAEPVRTASHANERSDLARAVEAIANVENIYVCATTPNDAWLLPTGIPQELRGVNGEAHGVIASPHHRLSLALRWHGENVALLWEIDGPPGLRLTAPRVDVTFATTQSQGEALLRVVQ